MTTTLTLDMEDRTQRAWDEFITTLGVAEKATEELDDVAKQVAADMKAAGDIINESERRIEELAIAVRKGSDEFGNMSRSVKVTQERMQEVEKSMGFLKGGTIIEVGRALIDGLRAGSEFISSMAERGNVQFMKLDGSIKNLKSSWEKFWDTVAKTDVGGKVLEWAERKISEIAEGIEALPELYENLGTVSDEYFASSVEGWGEYGRTVREAADYQSQLTAEVQRSRQEAIKAEEQEKAFAEGRKSAEEGLRALADDRRRQDDQIAASRIGNEQQLNIEIQKQEELLKSGKVTKEEVRAIVEKIVILEQRRSGVQAEYKKYLDDEAAGWRKYYDDRKRLEDDAIKQRETAEQDAARKRQEEFEKEQKSRLDIYQYNLKQQRDADEKANRERQKQQQELERSYSGGMSLGDARTKSVDIEMKTQQQIGQIRQQQIQQYIKGDVQGFMQSQQKQYEILGQSLQAQKELREKFAKEGNVLDQLKGSMSEKDILSQIEKNRIDKLRQDREKNRPDPFANDDVVDPQEARIRARYDRETKRQEQNTRRNLRRDMQQGNVGEEEVAKATNDLAGKTIDAAQKSGDLSKQQADALRAAADAQQKQADNAKSQGEEINTLKERFEEIAAQVEGDSMANARGRSRRAGR